MSGVSRARVATIAIIALVVVDVGLVALALAPRAGPDEGSARVVVEEPSPAPPESAAPEQEAEPDPEPDEVVAAPLRRLLDASSPTEAWRLETGDCPADGGLVQRTTDGGQTWEDIDVEQDAFVRVKTQSSSTAFLVAVEDEGCAPVFLGTTTGGQEWAVQPGSLEVAWYVEPVDATAVHSPEGVQPGPCGADVVDLAPVSSTGAGLLCPDGRVLTTDDAAVSWDELVAVPGAVAVTDSGQGYLAAALGTQGCDGVQVVRAGPEAPEPLGCAPTPAEPGQVAISSAGDSVWVWAGDEVLVSGDGGRTWG